MKRRLLNLVIIPALLCSIPAFYNSVSADGITLSNIIVEKLVESLNGKVEMDTTLDFLYDNGLPSLRIIDQYDTSNRVNVIRYRDMVLQELYLTKNSSGVVLEQYLTVSNEIDTRELTDSSGKGIKFDSNYSSPFNAFTNLKASQINSYFDIVSKNETYILKANDKGYGILSNSLINNFADFDGYVWDTSMSESLENLELTISKEGIPLNISFTKVKKDIFGGVRENYNSKINIIDNISTLKPFESKMSEEAKNTFDLNMNSFQKMLDKGNFAHNIKLESQALVEAIEYTNYYALNESSDSKFIEAMICSFPLEEATQGKTYVTLLNSGTNDSPVFGSYGISPDSKYYGNINDETYTKIDEIVPRISEISSSFFTYVEEGDYYLFDFSSFLYGDSYFYGTLLIDLFGLVDPFVHNLGFYIDNYSYNFNSLKIQFDSNGYPSGTLNYNYNNYIIESTFNFSDIGNIDLVEIEDVQEPVEFICEYML